MIRKGKLNMLFSIFESKVFNNKDLNFKQRVEVFLKIYYRNFKLYKGLKVAFDIEEIIFILQPLIDWTNKRKSPNEKKVISYLNQSGLKDEIDKEFRSISEAENIRFINANNFFADFEDDCFVDSVHLNDNGCKIISDKILKL